MLFFPSLVLSPAIGIAIIPFLFFKKTMMNALLFISLLLSASSVLDSTYTTFSVDFNTVSEIGAIAIEDGALKRWGRYGFPAVLKYSSDDSSLFSSSSGEVYIYSGKEDVRAGDYIRCTGSFSSPSFFTAESIVVEKPSLFKNIRKSAEALLRARLHSLSDGAENLSLMLLLAISDDGDSPISIYSREKGVSHVFALSGMHLSLISSFFIPLLSLFFSEKNAKRIVLVPLFLFTFLSGFRASLLRALLFRILFSLFPRADKNVVFCLTFILHASLFPQSLMRAGAVFSYLSIAGLFLLSPVLEELSERIFRFRFAFLFNSISCLIFTIPYSFFLFESYSLSSIIYSPIINFLVSIYMGLLIIFLIFPIFPSVLSALYSLIIRILSFDFLNSSFVTIDAYCIILFFSLSPLLLAFLKRNVLPYILKPCGNLITKKRKR